MENNLNRNKCIIKNQILDFSDFGYASLEEFWCLFEKEKLKCEKANKKINTGMEFIAQLLDKVDSISSNRQLNQWINGLNKSITSL